MIILQSKKVVHSVSRITKEFLRVSHIVVVCSRFLIVGSHKLGEERRIELKKVGVILWEERGGEGLVILKLNNQ